MCLKHDICNLTQLSEYSYCNFIFEIGIYFTEKINKRTLIYSKDFWDFILVEIHHLDTIFLTNDFKQLTNLEIQAMYYSHVDYYFENKINTLLEIA